MRVTKAMLEAELGLAQSMITKLQADLVKYQPVSGPPYLYHCYSFHASVVVDGYTPDHWSWPEQLLRTQLDDETAEIHGLALYGKAVDAKMWKGDISHARLSRITWTYYGLQPWAINWFSHYTHRDGRDDGELFASFEKYVMEHEDYQDWPYEQKKALFPDGNYRCLMGAEDRWRWKGPCTCKICTAKNLATFTH